MDSGWQGTGVGAGRRVRKPCRLGQQDIPGGLEQGDGVEACAVTEVGSRARPVGFQS